MLASSSARQGLDQLHPAVTAFLSRFHLPQSDLDVLLLQAQESSAEAAVSTYLARHPNRIRYWTTGEIQKSTKSHTKRRNINSTSCHFSVS